MARLIALTICRGVAFTALRARIMRARKAVNNAFFKSFVAECKGGVINSRHAGRLSRLRQGLCETIGLSLSVPIAKGKRQFAVVPRTPTTETLAQRMSPSFMSSNLISML
jgi:hypothetical protein